MGEVIKLKMVMARHFIDLPKISFYKQSMFHPKDVYCIHTRIVKVI